MSADVALLRDAANAMFETGGPVWPLVGDLLEESADRLEAHIPAWRRPSQGVDDPPALCWGDPVKLADTVEHHHGRALAVARAYLREAGERT